MNVITPTPIHAKRESTNSLRGANAETFVNVPNVPNVGDVDPPRMGWESRITPAEWLALGRTRLTGYYAAPTRSALPRWWWERECRARRRPAVVTWGWRSGRWAALNIEAGDYFGCLLTDVGLEWIRAQLRSCRLGPRPAWTLGPWGVYASPLHPYDAEHLAGRIAAAPVFEPFDPAARRRA